MRRLAPALLALAGLACKPAPSNPPEPGLDPRVARLCGTWRAEDPQGVIVEERWQANGEGLVGQGVTTSPEGEVVSRESLVIRLDGERSIYQALPEGAPSATPFEQTTDQAGDAADRWIWAWHNPRHDFPQTIRYQFDGGDRLRASISGPDGEGGTREFGWEFERVAACGE